MLPFLKRLAGSAQALALVLLPAAAAGQQTVDMPGEDRALAGQIEDLWSVGVAEGADHEMFSNVAAVAFDTDGYLYVADRDNGRVQVFDRDGSFVRQIGKKGQGPGELGQPLALTLTADGKIVVADVGRGAFSIFTRDGEFERNVLFGAAVGPFVRQMHYHSGGGVVVPGARFRFGGGGPGPGGGASEKQAILHHDLAEGSEARVVYEADAPQMQVRTSGSADNRTVMVSAPPVFAPDVDWAVLPGGGLIVSNGVEYAITVVSPDGQVSHRLARPIEARPVSEADREAAREQRRQAMSSGQGMIRVEANNGNRSTSVGGSASDAMIRRALENMNFAETVPAIQDIETLPGGRIWVIRAPDAGVDAGPIDVIDADGTYRGTLPAGTTVPVAFASDGRAAYIERDEWDVAQVVVRRLPAAWR